MIAGTAVAAGAALTARFGGEAAAAEKSAAGVKVKTYKNADFYDADGKFLEDKAREAYFDMFRRFGYPISRQAQEGNVGPRFRRWAISPTWAWRASSGSTARTTTTSATRSTCCPAR